MLTIRQPPMVIPGTADIPPGNADLPSDAEDDDDLDTKALIKMLLRRELRQSRSPSTAPAPVVVSSKDANARAPDTFDGKDPSQLNRFVRACKVYFLNNPSRFLTDRSKVLYAGSYLTGLAGDWFEPYTDNTGEHDTVLDSWTTFEDSIRSMFGDPNLKATAEFKLDTMVMKDNDQVSSYITTFLTYSKQLDWDDAGKRYFFKKGLPSRILDRTAEMDFPDTLEGIMSAAKKVDDRHWAREREKKLLSRASVQSIPFKKEFDSPRTSKFTSITFDRSKTSGAKPYRSSTATEYTRQSSATPSTKDKKNLDKVLNTEGKLTASEKARRSEKGLCNYCAGPHKIDNCPIRPQTTSARLASTQSEGPVTEQSVQQGKE